jgi:DNA-binding transcriptional LysR family regulator
MSYLPQLQTFLEVYRLGSITAAAVSLNMTQPGASAHIQILENKLGKSLFIRRARGVDPTVFADELAIKIGSPMAQVEDYIDGLSVNSDAIKGDIFVGGPLSYISAQLLEKFASLNQHQIQTHFSFGGKDHIYQLLDNQEIDFAITASKIQHAQLTFQTLEHEKLILVAGAEFMAQHQINNITINNLLTKPMIAYDNELPLIRDYFKLTSEQIAAIKPIIAVPDLRSMLDLVSKNYGYTVLPEYLCTDALKNKEIIELTQFGQPVLQAIYLVTHNLARASQRVKFVKKFILNSFVA